MRDYEPLSGLPSSQCRPTDGAGSTFYYVYTTQSSPGSLRSWTSLQPKYQQTPHLSRQQHPGQGPPPMGQYLQAGPKAPERPPREMQPRCWSYLSPAAHIFLSCLHSVKPNAPTALHTGAHFLSLCRLSLVEVKSRQCPSHREQGTCQGLFIQSPHPRK